MRLTRTIITPAGTMRQTLTVSSTTETNDEIFAAALRGIADSVYQDCRAVNSPRLAELLAEIESLLSF